MSEDWTKTKVNGATVTVITFGIIGVMCAGIWASIMMAPKNDLRRSDYMALRIFAIITLVSLGISIWTALVQIRGRFPDSEQRTARFKQAMLGLGGIAAAFALGMLSYALATPGGLAFIPTGLALAGMLAIVTAMQGES